MKLGPESFEEDTAIMVDAEIPDEEEFEGPGVDSGPRPVGTLQVLSQGQMFEELEAEGRDY